MLADFQICISVPLNLDKVQIGTFCQWMPIEKPVQFVLRAAKNDPDMLNILLENLPLGRLTLLLIRQKNVWNLPKF